MGIRRNAAEFSQPAGRSDITLHTGNELCCCFSTCLESPAHQTQRLTNVTVSTRPLHLTRLVPEGVAGGHNTISLPS